MFANNEAVTGIDLGAASVKLVRVRRGRGLEKLLNVAVADISADTPAGWAEAAPRALRGLLDGQGLKTRDLGSVHASVSGPAVHLRQVEMPPLSEAELKASLRYECRKHLPLDTMGEAAIDCQVLARTTDARGSMSVLVVGAPEALVQSRVRALAAVGIEPELVDVAPLACINALSATDPDALDADRSLSIIDLGASATVLTFVRKNGVVYSRSLPPVNGPVANMAVALNQAFRETAAFYAQMNERRPVDQVFLCGGGSLTGGLAEALQKFLGVPVSPLDACRRLIYSPSRNQELPAEELAALSPRLAVAVGLLYRINGDV